MVKVVGAGRGIYLGDMESRQITFFSFNERNHSLMKIVDQGNVVVLYEMHIAAVLRFQPLPGRLKNGGVALLFTLVILGPEPG